MLCRAAFHFFWFERESVLMVFTWKIVNGYLTLRRKWNVNKGQPESVFGNLLIVFLVRMCFGRTWNYGYKQNQKSSEVHEKIESVVNTFICGESFYICVFLINILHFRFKIISCINLNSQGWCRHRWCKDRSHHIDNCYEKDKTNQCDFNSLRFRLTSVIVDDTMLQKSKLIVTYCLWWCN